ncbi:deoxyribose-phosphate aldolase [uncultured Desulfuromonas sp.]|uniref:deoxyribose-phosphate aldolase n=1 Tax=uncultured Desulfuromonas sp. TaxID=181013 RepID=UPI002AABF022|nr:deoxyribose-phosphate aldolase [uncultured Desulfuromonas sp.]
MSFLSPAALIDHTLLAPTACAADFEQLCEEAVEFGCASVCVPASRLPLVTDLLHGSEVAVATVIGFPLGYETTTSKVMQATEACHLGADEIDMVIHGGWAQEGHYAQIEQELADVNRACEGRALKVIIECCYLNDQQKRKLTEVVMNAGAAYVKTSTGFGSGGATVADVALLAEVTQGKIGIKAAGGIRDYATFQAMVDVGATRIGCSATATIIDQWLKIKEEQQGEDVV